MKSIIFLFLILAVSINASQAEDISVFPMEPGMEHYEKSKFYSEGAQLYFGEEADYQAEGVLASESFTRRTSSKIYKESDDSAARRRAKVHALCKYVFSSVVQAMKQHANELGADAIVNIRSNYKNNQLASASEYQCVQGGILTAVALKADYVKLK